MNTESVVFLKIGQILISRHSDGPKIPMNPNLFWRALKKPYFYGSFFFFFFFFLV